MTDQRYQDLPPAKRRRLIVWAALRSLLVAAVLVVLYYVLPLDRPWDSDTWIRLLVFAGVMVWQVRTIAGSPYPGVRGAETLALILPLFLLLFASTYFEMERASAASFTQPLTRTDARTRPRRPNRSDRTHPCPCRTAQTARAASAPS